MKDFLHAIFSRGASASTFTPLVMVGGVDYTSNTQTVDVLQFSGGAALVYQVNPTGVTVSGTVNLAGTGAVNVVQWGGSNVQSASFGVPTVGWFQRLDATNDAITVYQNVTNSNWSVIASQSGANWTQIASQSGSWTVSIRDSSQNTIIATNTTPALSAQGVNVRPIGPTTTLRSYTFIAGTTGSVVVAATDGNRRLAVANNDSTAVMYLNYDVTAGTFTYFVRIPSLGYWEMPEPIWQGSLSAIWDSVNTGAGRFTILT